MVHRLHLRSTFAVPLQCPRVLHIHSFTHFHTNVAAAFQSIVKSHLDQLRVKCLEVWKIETDFGIYAIFFMDQRENKFFFLEYLRNF